MSFRYHPYSGTCGNPCSPFPSKYPEDHFELYNVFRLQEEGFVVSANPTTEEIEEAKAKYQLQKELADIDPHSPIKRPRRPVAGDDETGTGTNDAKNSTDKKDDSNVMNSSLQKENQISGSGKKIKKNNSDDDEEAEF